MYYALFFILLIYNNDNVTIELIQKYKEVTMEKIKITNQKLKNYLEYELNKEQDEPIYIEELDNITQVTINGKSIDGDTIYKTISDLKYFKNLKNCMIKDFQITDNEIEIINNLSRLEKLHFDNCKFENKYAKINLDIERLILSFCKDVNMKVFNISNSIKYLRITSGDKIDLENIEYFTKIEKLYLQSIIIKDLEIISKLKELKYLNLNGSKILKNKKYIENLHIEVEHKKNNYPV